MSPDQLTRQQITQQQGTTTLFEHGDPTAPVARADGVPVRGLILGRPGQSRVARARARLRHRLGSQPVWATTGAPPCTASDAAFRGDAADPTTITRGDD